MAVDPGRHAGGRGLTDRRAERDVLDRLVAAVRLGESRVLVMRGEPGMGKTALLDYLAGRAAGCWVLRVSGVQWEMELAFAGIHQLCAPLLGRLEVLPGLTGLWQIQARQDSSFAKYIALDTAYVENWSFWLDLKILVRTAEVVVRGTGT